MRVHQLSVTAFGPFADTQYVDFDALAEGGLFLFHGPTGAGKTSILDAVCFALYGQVPGARHQARSLRSDHADPDLRPEVVLQVTLRGRLLRVTRSPAWERPKRRGSGTTTEQARVLLQEADGAGAGRADAVDRSWRTLSTRADEAGHLLSRLLGLTPAQFCQVALLPQGQFAEFLRADADRRRDVLESLFDTGRFTAAEAWLVNERKAVWTELEALDRRVDHVLARVAQAAGVDVPPELVADDAGDWVAVLLAEAEAEKAATTQAAANATSARAEAAAQVTAATQLRERQARRDTWLRQQAELDAAWTQRDAAVAELEAALAVAPVLPLLEEVARLQVELESVRVDARSAHQQVAGFLAATGTSGAAVTTHGLPSADSATRSSALARAEIGGLHRLVDDEEEAARISRDADALERTIVALEAQSAELGGWLDDADARRSALIEARSAAQSAEAGLPAAREDVERAGVRATAGARRDVLAIRVGEARDAVQGATDAAQLAREHWLTLRQARLDGMAAELAARLVAGEHCPVCGSTSHPAPATATVHAVTREDEERAAEQANAAEELRALSREQLSALDVELAEARSAAGGTISLGDLQTALDRASRRLRDLEDVAAGRTAAEAAVATFDDERESRVREHVRLAQEREGARARSGELQSRLRRLRAVLTAARGDDPSITARAKRLERLADGCDGLARQVIELERLDGAVDDALERAEASVRERSLGSLATAADAARDEARITELDEFRRRHDTEHATLAELLADPALVEAAVAPVPDLAALSAAQDAAELAHEAAVEHAAALRQRASSLKALRGKLDAAIVARGPVAERYRVADALSRLAEGKSKDNRLRMSLSGYVLAARLEQVAAAASERLLRMTSQRFSLLHTAEAGTGRGRRGGLHLRVLDAWTGNERDPATLSGGEAFSASLALALGLADVVTAEAGGSLLETLFVDEGFGSLDEDSLDEVMGVLDDLRDGGRVVGIVSHVSDLRQRIPVQLRVDKGRHGSSVRQ